MPSGHYEHKKIDMAGQTIGFTHIDGLAYYDAHGMGFWHCTCMYNGCGEKFVRSRNSLIKHSNDANCGCYDRIKQIDGIRQYHSDSIRHLPHGVRITSIRKDMIARCDDKKAKAYKNYGGRGIKVCKEWRESKTNFYEWAISHGYQDDLTIDRIDNDGDYSPENCRWVTRAVQNSNTSRNVRYEYMGKLYLIKELSEVTGIKADTILKRIRKGYSIDEACYPYSYRTGKRLING